MRIYLIGMPGSGKSTLGKVLAERFQYRFIDMDSYIEQEACMFIDEIFQAFGEEYFRALEKNTLKEFLKEDDLIIATGGGIIKDKSNKELLDGVCIYLNVDTDTLKQRLEESEITRPVLKENTVEELFLQRKELYSYFADYEIDNTSMESAIQKIMEVLS